MRGFAHESAAAETVEWYTPPSIFAALGLTFDLDPCAPQGGVPWIPVAESYCEADDGLTRPWRGRVWLNPPYGRHTAAWMHRLAAHDNGIALVFARTDTAWFHETVGASDAVLFLRGRISFVRPDGRDGDPAAAPSVLVAYGAECAEALHGSGLGLAVSIDAPRVGQPNLWAAASA